MNANTYPGADIDSDNNPVAAKLQIKLKRVMKAKPKHHWKLDRLKYQLLSMEYICTVNANMSLDN